MATELLRVVVEPATADKADRSAPGAPSQGPGPDVVSIVPDPRRRAPGRGAWLHPDLRCVDLAQRRRAFARALRVAAAVDPSRVREYVEQRCDERYRTEQGETPPGSSREGEQISYGHSMKRQK